MCFPFMMDTHLPADIDDHLLDHAGKWPGILARIVPRDGLATIPPNVQTFACNRELAWLGPDLTLADLLVVDIDGQGAVGDVRRVLSRLGDDGRKRRGPG